MKQRLLRLLLFVTSVVLAGIAYAQSDMVEIARIRTERQTGFENGGWKYDRYPELKSLDAGASMVVADLEGPGIIRHIHTTRHRPKESFARGIVLEIWFDDSDKPSILCPLGDFFGDGCNGESMNFSSLFIECAPWSYNCYFPMPFESRARVILRNDTDRDAMNYSYVEWESLPEWDDELGYFHATYVRKYFTLTKETRETFFDFKGSGHLLGRQFSVVSDEPIFSRFSYVMEGNNEVDIDGKDRCLDYLGTEDSFTFSWGFRESFAGLRAGMPYVETSHASFLNRLSIYRFHDHMPIRFNHSIRWSIDWRHEKMFTHRPAWQKAVEVGGCGVDYAVVFYWYADCPGGYDHKALLPVAQRRKPMIHSVE